MLEQAVKNARILIVDDQYANVCFLQELLAHDGFTEVRSTTQSRDAVALYRVGQHDIVLLDLHMPEVDGFTILRELRSLKPDSAALPVLVLTADTASGAMQRALSEGASDFLAKPLDAVETLLRIKNLLRIHLLHVQLEEQNQALEQIVARRTHELDQSRAQLRALAASQTRVREEERTAIAREVHDELGQALTALKLELASLHRQAHEGGQVSAPVVQQKTTAMMAQVDATIQAVRRIATQLRPGLLDDFGLEAAVEWQVQEFGERTGTLCEFVSSLEDLPLPRDQATSAFRILQEALTNVTRHAAATQVSVLLEENGGQLVMQVQDNGRGIRAEEVAGMRSLGLLGMQERARLVGGEVQVQGTPDRGTTVTVRLPLQVGETH